MVTGDMLHRLAFDNSLQANIITRVSMGKIIAANNAACKLLGYSKKELLTQSRKNIFDINENSFKKMLKERNLGEAAQLHPGDMVFVPQNSISKIAQYLSKPSLSMYVSSTQF